MLVIFILIQFNYFDIIQFDIIQHFWLSYDNWSYDVSSSFFKGAIISLPACNLGFFLTASLFLICLIEV